MKVRFVWRWVLTYEDGSAWYGTCPMWAAQPVPDGATLTRHRVMVVAQKKTPCNVPRCNSAHYSLPAPN